MIEWVEKMSYFIPKGIKIKIDVFKGLKLKESYEYKSKEFVELLDRIATDTRYSPKCEFNGNESKEDQVNELIMKNGKETVVNKKVHRDIELDVAFRYVPESITCYDTYCNFTNTVDGGIHQDVFEQCFCRYMTSKVYSTMTDAQKEKTKILWDDIKSGLCAVINLATNAQVGFVGNAKRRIANEELIPYLKKIVNNGLNKFFEENPSILADYIKIIKLNAKARIEMQKVKTATQKERLNSFKEHEMKNYIRCNNTGRNDYRELFLVEGDSPSGSGRNGCDPNTQAFFMFRGVTANPFKCSLAQIMENREWKDFVTVLRCGIGNNFDINKLYFKRINIMTDADVDGYNISSGMLAFIYKYLRPLIEQGYVYKVFTPLYKINDKENPFVVNKTELIELYHKKIAKTYKIKSINDDKYMSKDEFVEFLTDTYDYRENLIRLADNTGKVYKFFLEDIIAHLTLLCITGKNTLKKPLDDILSNQKFIKTFMSNIQKDYKEVSYKDGKVQGIVNGHLTTVKISQRLLNHAEEIIPIYQKYGYKIKVKNKNNDTETVMTIGEFLDSCMKLMPDIFIRFKGLGELEGKELFQSTLDPNSRISVQYTVEDAKRELGIFQKIHGAGKKDLEARKKMMSEYRIKRDDLDN